MWVLKFVAFFHISHHIFSLNHRPQIYYWPITWGCVDIILNNTHRELDQLLLHLEGTDNIPKELYELIGSDDTKSNAYVNEPQTMTKV